MILYVNNLRDAARKLLRSITTSCKVARLKKKIKFINLQIQQQINLQKKKLGTISHSIAKNK